MSTRIVRKLNKLLTSGFIEYASYPVKIENDYGLLLGFWYWSEDRKERGFAGDNIVEVLTFLDKKGLNKETKPTEPTQHKKKSYEHKRKNHLRVHVRITQEQKKLLTSLMLDNESMSGAIKRLAGLNTVKGEQK